MTENTPFTQYTHYAQVTAEKKRMLRVRREMRATIQENIRTKNAHLNKQYIPSLVDRTIVNLVELLDAEFDDSLPIKFLADDALALDGDWIKNLDTNDVHCIDCSRRIVLLGFLSVYDIQPCFREQNTNPGICVSCYKNLAHLQ